MIPELAVGLSLGFAGMNALALWHMYREYRILAEVSLEFAGKVLATVREEDGEIITDPVVLAGEVMDHLSQISGIVKWIIR